MKFKKYCPSGRYVSVCLCVLLGVNEERVIMNSDLDRQGRRVNLFAPNGCMHWWILNLNSKDKSPINLLDLACEKAGKSCWILVTFIPASPSQNSFITANYLC